MPAAARPPYELLPAAIAGATLISVNMSGDGAGTMPRDG